MKANTEIEFLQKENNKLKRNIKDMEEDNEDIDHRFIDIEKSVNKSTNIRDDDILKFMLFQLKEKSAK